MGENVGFFFFPLLGPLPWAPPGNICLSHLLFSPHRLLSPVFSNYFALFFAHVEVRSAGIRRCFGCFLDFYFWRRVQSSLLFP